ncbi:MAG TPA: 7-cyano-7-deazaguanine synthase [Candidatus Nanoarchaeia archaeon]|nr:7-cyano-7-deazaguanine synthase [Candidatus Nanoarchaeia archaeon]
MLKKKAETALLLLSGGFDSAVAAHLMQQKGLQLIALHFYNKHLSDINTIDKCKILCKKLKIKKLFLIPFDEEQAELVRKCEHRLYFVLMRRLMLRIAEQLAKKEKCTYLITGENLGQVASQTLSNMINTTKAVKMPILRPLLCYDKSEIMSLAKKIDTYETSKGPEICCLLGPKHPATKTSLREIEYEEKKIDLDNIISGCLKKIELSPLSQKD